MQLIINDKFKNDFTIDNIENLIKILNYRKPDFHRVKEKRKIWQLNYNGFNIFVKNFSYNNKLVKKIKSLGAKNYKIAKFFLKNNIKTPEPVFYFSYKNDEYFSTISIKNSVDLWEYLSLKPDSISQKKVISQLKELIFKFETLNVYHSDFNIRNLILERDSIELYILDLEAVRFNFNKRRKEKMLRKINKYLKAFNLSI